MTTREFAHEPGLRRYVARVDGVIASVLDYRELGDAVAFVRTFTNPPYRGSGLAADLTQFAVDDVEERTRRQIVPSCWYVEQWFDRHPERRGLLDPRTT